MERRLTLLKNFITVLVIKKNIEGTTGKVSDVIRISHVDGLHNPLVHLTNSVS